MSNPRQGGDSVSNVALYATDPELSVRTGGGRDIRRAVGAGNTATLTQSVCTSRLCTFLADNLNVCAKGSCGESLETSLRYRDGDRVSGVPSVG